MKYQHIIDNIVQFETNDPGEFATYLLYDPKAKQDKASVLFKLLDQIGEYKCKMVTK